MVIFITEEEIGTVIKQKGYFRLKFLFREPYMSLLNWAKKYLSLGYSVIPIAFKDKKPVLSSWTEYQKRLPTQEEILQWFNGTKRNIAIVTGKISNLVVIDIDNPEANKEIVELLDKAETVTVQTSRGLHYYFKHDERVKNAKLPGIDIKSDGSYVIAPPSLHASGVMYKFTSLQMLERPVKTIPEEFFKFISSSKTLTDQQAPQTEEEDFIYEGQRNNYLTSLAGSLRTKGLNREEIFQILKIVNQHRCIPPLKEEELLSIAKSISRYPSSIESLKEQQIVELFLQQRLDVLSNNNTFQDIDIVKGLIYKNSVCIVDGMGATGKSHLLLQLSVAVATGTRFLDFDTTQGKILYIDGEDHAYATQKRLQQIKPNYDPEVFNAALKSIHYISLRTLKFPPPFHLLNKDMKPTKLYRTIKKLCQEISPNLIIFDPLVSFVYDENSNAYAIQFYSAIIELAEEAAVVIAHHNNKTAMTERETIKDRAKTRGAGAWGENAKTRLYIKENTIKIDKCNYNYKIQGKTLHVEFKNGMFAIKKDNL